MADTAQLIIELTDGQLGMFTRQQARDAGITPDQLRSRVKSGFLQKAGHNVYRLAGTPWGPRRALRALMLDVGGDVWASAGTAAALHGFDGFELAPPFDVTIRRGRDVKRVGHRIHTTFTLEPIDETRISGFPVLSPARTLIDLARTTDARTLTVALDSALRDRRLTEHHLHRRIVALRSVGRYGLDRLIDVIAGSEVIRGAHSYLERRFLELVHERGLPRPTPQRVLGRTNGRVIRVDFRFPASRVVVETLGYEWHRTKEQMSRDAARLNALIADGFHPYQFTNDQVIGHPDEVMEQVAAALSADRAA